MSDELEKRDDELETEPTVDDLEEVEESEGDDDIADDDADDEASDEE